jgi:glycosyltransferase involved in cell wall biosynthesis
MADDVHPVLVLISSYPPRKCGIATFSYDLAIALDEHVHNRPPETGTIEITAMNDDLDGYDYGREVTHEIYQHSEHEYREAADILNTSRADVVCLQHEYGLYGGEEGEYLLQLLQRLHKPLVSTLHTVLNDPKPKQKEVLQAVCERSSTVVVMAERARRILGDVYGVPPDRVRLLHHGTPDLPFGDTEPFKERFGLAGRPTILTFGLLSPSKNIEVMIEALAKVVPTYPEVVYVVLGATHPMVREVSGESYRLSLERLVVSLGLQHNVIFHNRYVSYADLCEYLQAADIYVTPYQGRDQITSGTLAYAVASGRAVISTPYFYAEELLADGRGRLVGFEDVGGFARCLDELLSDKEVRERMRRAAYDFGRQMTWKSVARQYAQTFEDARATFVDRARELVRKRRPPMRLSLPELRLDHLFILTDDTGILQHARYATPTRSHGYCTDDNARALIVGAMVWSLTKDETIVPYTQTYLSFLEHAQPEDEGFFRNTMSYDRRWMNEEPSQDCHGRVLWALGHLISHPPLESMRLLATNLFHKAFTSIDLLRHPRSIALSILGLHYYLREFGTDDKVRDTLRRLANRLKKAFSDNQSDEWRWFDDIVTYGNARMPQALIIAGFILDDRDLIQLGLQVLEWLLKIQSHPDGHLSLIGNHGWYPRGGERAQFDQQPLEVASLIGACKAAYRASDDAEWLTRMRHCFEWFLGRNDHGVSMIDFSTRGCYDGLQPNGPNANQGAESLLSWLLSLAIMHELQTGETPEIG